MLSSPFHRWGIERQHSTLSPNSQVVSQCAPTLCTCISHPSSSLNRRMYLLSGQPLGWALWEESHGKAQGKAKDDTRHGDLLASGKFQSWPPGLASAFLVLHFNPSFLPLFIVVVVVHCRFLLQPRTPGTCSCQSHHPSPGL